MKALRFYVFFISLLIGSTALGASTKPDSNAVQHPAYDLVFCLDLSGSTNGLINDVRDHLWLMANTLKCAHPEAELRIGVVGFSRPSFGKNSGYVKVLADLTNNIDYVAQELYKLKPSIEAGDQIVSAALSNCLDRVHWSKDPSAHKTIFIAGNGMVNADGYQYVKWCEEAAERNIVINSLYIPKGGRIMNELPGWRRIATITHGIQSEISINAIDEMSVFDGDYERVLQLNNKFNSTFFWVGRDSSICARSQFSADSGAYFSGSKDVFFNRVFYKLHDEYTKSFSTCDLIAADLNDTVPPLNVNGMNGGEDGSVVVVELKNKIIQQQDLRSKFREALLKELSVVSLRDYVNKYESLSVPQNSILHRVVLTTLLLQWK